MKYTYTAIFTPTGDKSEYAARIPDLPGCVTTGDDLYDAVEQIADAAAVWLIAAEDEEIVIAPPTAQKDIPHGPEDILSIIRIDTIAYREKTDERSVRKNVSLPGWMALLADKRSINCSQVLQDSLRAIFEREKPFL